MSLSLEQAIVPVAPFLASLLDGPFGIAAEKVISQVLMGNEDTEIDEMVKDLANATPEQLAELKRIDADYKVEMAALSSDEAKETTLDSNSTHKFEAIVQSKIPAILSILLTIGFFTTLFTLIHYPVQVGMQSVIQVMLGALGTSWIASITYYFGSSYGSDIKTQYMIQK